MIRSLLRAFRNWRSGTPKALSAGNGDASWVIGDPGATHPYEVAPDHGAASAIAGMQFIATMQVRTPLRILNRHGQVLPLGAKLPDDFERWMGIWVPKAKTFREIGLDIDEPGEGEMASPAGPVRASEYLPFLIAVRSVVEDAGQGIGERMARLQDVCARPEFARFVAAEGGAEGLCDRFFTPVLSLIPGPSAASKKALKDLGLSTVAALRAASDGALLTVKGIGPANLAAIRAFCAAYEGNPDAERSVNIAH